MSNAAIAAKTPAELLVDECTDARKKFERAEVEYLAFLQGVEKTRGAVWKPGWGSFENFLENAVGLPRVSRYGSFCDAVSKLGMAKVRALGVDGAVMALSASSPAAQTAYEKAAEAWVKVHDGVHPHGDTPKKLLRQVDPQREEPRAVGQMRELEELRAQCDKLKRENHKLSAEVEKLKKENAELRKKNK